MTRLVEISTIEFPPQLADHQAQHMLENFQRSVEQQGLQLPQYLRLVGKDQETFEAELRTQAESQVRRSLALDAFATAEQIDVEQTDLEDEVRRATSGTDDAASVEQLAMANPETRQRLQEITRERKAMTRLIEVATADGAVSEPATAPEKDTPSAPTSDTEEPSPEPVAHAAAAGAEDRETA
jgi:trigger factor